MNKRIEELEDEKKMEEKDFNLKESSLGDFLNYIRILARIQERKLAEKEFLELIDKAPIHHATKAQLKKELEK